MRRETSGDRIKEWKRNTHTVPPALVGTGWLAVWPPQPPGQHRPSPVTSRLPTHTALLALCAVWCWFSLTYFLSPYSPPQCVRSCAQPLTNTWEHPTQGLGNPATRHHSPLSWDSTVLAWRPTLSQPWPPAMAKGVQGTGAPVPGTQHLGSEAIMWDQGSGSCGQGPGLGNTPSGQHQ